MGRAREWSGLPGAVVIGGDYQGLAIARSLGRRGLDVVLIDDERSIGRYSRYLTGHARFRRIREAPELIDALFDTGRRFGLDGWVLYPTREESVAAISRHRDELLEQFRVPTPPWEAVQWAWDKRNTYRRAAELGIPTPRSWVVAELESLAEIAAEPPFVIKPAIKERFLYATGQKAWRADSRAELDRRVREASRLTGPDEIIVQELIPGPGSDQLAYCAFFKDGRTRARMVVERLRQHPLEFGKASTFARTIDSRELDDASERFLRSIGYYGLVELEYKRDPRDGTTKLLDVNPRTWGYHGLGALAGVDFPAHLYADQLDLAPPDSGDARSGVAWVRLATDLPTAALLLAKRMTGWREYLSSLHAVRGEAVFARDDPLPGLAELALLPYLVVKRGF